MQTRRAHPHYSKATDDSGNVESLSILYCASKKTMIQRSFPVGPLRCNCSILGDEVSREALVVDPGGNVLDIFGLLQRDGLVLKAILVTHAHLDHIAGARALQELTGAPILYNQLDLPLVATMADQAEWMGVPVPDVRPPDASAEAGMTIRMGDIDAHVLHTPGHTPGSISLHVPSASLLLAGDTLFRRGIGRTDLPGGNASHILRSIRDQLLHLPEGTRVIAGHGSDTTIGAEREHNPWLRNE